MGKRAAYIFIVLILALCLTPSVGMLAQHAGMEEGTGGNETLAALPTRSEERRVGKECL